MRPWLVCTTGSRPIDLFSETLLKEKEEEDEGRRRMRGEGMLLAV